MGDRLVQKIYYKGKFLAASYNHWSAGDWELFETELDNAIVEFDLLKDENATPLNAVKVLIAAVDKALNGTAERVAGDNYCGLEDYHHCYIFDGEAYISNNQKVFVTLHPEIEIGRDHTSGIITVDEKVADYWESFAEALNNFDFS